jgi:hypothetical protein
MAFSPRFSVHSGELRRQVKHTTQANIAASPESRGAGIAKSRGDSSTAAPTGVQIKSTFRRPSALGYCDILNSILGKRGSYFFALIDACAAANRAIGTR